MIFPPPFEVKTADGAVVLVDDVDVLLDVVAKHARLEAKALDRRRLEAALDELEVPALHAERAVMVFLGRRRQARLASVHRGAMRLRALGVFVVLTLVLVVYGNRLESRLGAKLARAEAAQALYLRERMRTEAAMGRLNETRFDAPSRAELEIALNAAEDRLASARRRYDSLANDYVAAVRGFPTSPFANFVGLPQRVPMSWELARRASVSNRDRSSSASGAR